MAWAPINAENDLQTMIIGPIKKVQQEIRQHWDSFGRSVYKMADENLGKSSAAIVKKLFHSMPFAVITALTPWSLFLPGVAVAYVIHAGYKPFSKELSGNIINGAAVGSALLVVKYAFHHRYGDIIYAVACYKLLQNSNLIVKS